MASARALRALGLLLAALAGAGAAHAGGSVQEVADCALRNLPPSAHARARLVSQDAHGKARTLEVEYWSRTPELGAREVVIARRGAPDDQIAAYRFSDGDAIGEAWAFTRSLGKPQRITTTGVEVRLFGTNVSIEDFARFARVLFPGQVRRLDDEEIAGRKAYVVEIRPSPEGGSAYARIVTAIDKEWCTVLRRESYEASFQAGAKPRKTYRVDPADVRVDAGFANARRARLFDERDGSSTELELLALELPARLDDALFTPDALPRAAR